MLVGDERALYAEVEHDHTDDQSEDRCPKAEQQPGHERQPRPQRDHPMRTAAIRDPAGDWRDQDSDRADDAEQAGDIGTETETRFFEMKREDGPEHREGGEQRGLRDRGEAQPGEFTPEMEE